MKFLISMDCEMLLLSKLCDSLGKQFENLGNNQFFLLESGKIDELPDSLLGLFPSNRFEMIQNKDSSGIHRK